MSRYPLNFKHKQPIQQITSNDDNDDYYNQYFDNCKTHYDTILEIFEPKKYSEVLNLMTNGGKDRHKDHHNYGTIIFVNKTLLLYAMKYDDVNILNLLFKHNIFVSEQSLFKIIFKHKNKKFFKIILDNVDLLSIFWRDLIFEIAKNNYDIYFLDTICKINIELYHIDIARIIVRNYIDGIKYLIANNYDIQDACNNYSASMSPITNETLKLLVNAGVNLTYSLDSIFIGCILRNDIDTITFLIHTYPEFDINDLVKICIEYNNITILKYILQCGGDINIINTMSLAKININFETIKFVIQLGIELKQETLNQHMIKCFIVDDVLLDNVLYLVDYGAEINYVFKFDESRKENIIDKSDKIRIQNGDARYVTSALENMICMGKMNHLKYLINNCYDMLMLEVDRLFVLSICNGQYDMAKCFLEMGVKVDDNALVCACFFGHLDMVKLLLGLDIDAHVVNDKFKLYDVVVSGFKNSNYVNDTYDKLIMDNMIFRNDIFQFGDGFMDIFKMLMDLSVSMKDCREFFRFKDFYTVEIISYFVLGGGNLYNYYKNAIYMSDLINKNIEIRNLFDEHGYVYMI